MSDFDMQKTTEIWELCQVPEKQRDDAWNEAFLSAVPHAGMAGIEQQIIEGPDGFPYFVLQFPTPGENFTPYSIAHVLDHCLENGLGVVFNLHDGTADYVFQYGDLLGYKLTGSFLASQELSFPDKVVGMAANVTTTQVEEGRGVHIGHPSEEFLPATTRQVMRDFLQNAFGVPEPKFCMIFDAATNPPHQFLFNIYPDEFENEEHFTSLMNALAWHLPPTHALIGASRGTFDEHMQPL